MTSVGCGGGGGADQPDLGKVTGKVTLDGKPLPHVIVMFKPDEGRPGIGETDDEGNYTLEYLYKVYGAKIGSNTVSFSYPDGGAGGPPLPAKYTSKTELKADVKKGSNTFDWDLKSK